MPSANVAVPITYSFKGLRAVSGRFASMADVGLKAIADHEAESLASEVQDLWRAAAPKSHQPVQPPRDKTFSESITAETGAAPGGFLIRVQTEQPDVRDYIRYGHRALGPSDLKNAKAFHFVIDGEDIFALHISAVAPNDWETRTDDASWPAIESAGNKIVAETARVLSGE